MKLRNPFAYTNLLFPFLISALFLLSITQCKSSSNNQELTMENAWIRLVPPSSRITGAYLKIHNSKISDRLVSASSAVSEDVEIHSMIEKEGMMMMRKLENGISLKPDEKSELRPGGNHLMLIGLKSKLKLGDRISIELNFEKQGKKTIEFEVKDASTMSP